MLVQVTQFVQVIISHQDMDAEKLLNKQVSELIADVTHHPPARSMGTCPCLRAHHSPRPWAGEGGCV